MGISDECGVALFYYLSKNTFITKNTPQNLTTQLTRVNS